MDRARTQFKICQDIDNKMEEMKSVVNTYYLSNIGIILTFDYTILSNELADIFNKIDKEYFTSNTTFDMSTAMARKYVKDIILYWAEEYKLSGIRIENMGNYDVNLINDSKTQTTKQMWEMRKELTGTIDEIFQDWESDYKLILNRISTIRSTSETGQMAARAELYEISAQIDELEANQAGLDPDSKLYQQNEQKIISLKKKN